MAITKLLRIKECKGRKKSAHLKNTIAYVCREDKTEGGLWIGGNAGLHPERIYQTILKNKESWGKEGGTQAFHYVLSFPPDCGVDEATAFQITEEFCTALLGGNYLHLFAVHNDKAHLHTHVIFDSVSNVDGYKFHSPRGDWQKRIQPITDKLCATYRLPTLSYEPGGDRAGRDYGTWRTDQKQGVKRKYTNFDIIRDDIDEAIDKSESYEAFLSYLRADHYKISRDGTYLSLQRYGNSSTVRTGRLGRGYSKTEIIARLSDKKLEGNISNRYKTYGDRAAMRDIIYAKTVRSPGWKMTPLQKQFYQRWNNTFFIRKPGRMPQRWMYKDDILQVETLADAIRYMVDHDIGSIDDLQKRADVLTDEENALQRELSVMQTKYYKQKSNVALKKYEKVKAAYEKEPTAALEKELESLMEEIESCHPYVAAVMERDTLKKRIDECRRVKADNKREQKLIGAIAELFYGMNQETPEWKTERSVKKERGTKTERDNKNRLETGGGIRRNL